MIKKKYLFRLFSILCINFLSAQELPPVKNYTPIEYKADNQNWGISQSSDKLIYVANNKGLLEFNGSHWRLYPSPNNTIMRSVFVDEDKIYTGCYMEFGYWQKDSRGLLTYVSLSSKIDKLVEDEQFWQIDKIKNWVLFQSLNKIYIYDTLNDSFEIVDPESKIVRMYVVDENVYLQKLNGGLYIIQNGEVKSIGEESEISKILIVNIFKHEDKLLILTEKDGFYYLDEEGRLNKWATDIDGLLNKVSIYCASRFRNEDFILGTISNGIIVLDHKGSIIYEINQYLGLYNNTVLSIYSDEEDNIWLGLDNGISSINSNSPFKIFNDSRGRLGTIYTSVVFNDTLYLGTNQGVFYKELNSEDNLNLIEGTKGQVWSLEIIDETLFCGHHYGTFIIEGVRAKKLENTFGTWKILKIPNNTNLLIQGNYDGLHILEKTQGNWIYKNKVKNFDISSRFIEFINPKEIVINHEYKGVFRLKIDSLYSNVLEYEILDSIEKSTNSALIKCNGSIWYSTKQGIYEFDSKENVFIKDSILSNFYNEKTYQSGKLVYDKDENRLWGFNKQGLVYIDFGGISKQYQIKRINLPNDRFNRMTGYENITHLNNGNYLVGTSNGYLVVDLNEIHSYKLNLNLSSVSVSGIDHVSSFLERDITEPEIDNKKNNIRFAYSVPLYTSFGEIEYQSRLLGLYDEWSNWSSQTDQTFENLNHGKYTFQVRARINDTLSDIYSYSFEIKRPWYLSSTMILIYGFLLITILFIVHIFYKTYYKRQRERLIQKAKRELELKEMESDQKLMGIKNEKLKQEIESKNRELAISTMSLIKKNEFLNLIKSELNNISSLKELKSITKLLDKNLNSTDDWKLFEEAFNNADKDFMKNLKSKHPNLTPNDLKLCAYLRLNLSSKEIAPLLNISHRSVEVKRYRLRKKMGLEHESGLTEYILEL